MLYTSKAIMQSGYQYDREASAKARKTLKTASKNKKMDSILYGADIKAESVFSTLDKKTPPPPGPPSTPAPAAPPLSIPAPTSTATAPTPSATTSAAPAPPTPAPATSSISGLRGLAPGRISVPPALYPTAVKSTLQSAIETPLPGSTRRPAPLETGTLTSIEEIPPLTFTQRAAAVVAPAIKNVGEVLESYAKSPTSSQAPTVASTAISPISLAQVPVGSSSEPLSPAQSSGAPPFSEAGSEMGELEEKGATVTYDPKTDTEIQDKAKELFDLVRHKQSEVQMDKKVDPNQTTITPLDTTSKIIKYTTPPDDKGKTKTKSDRLVVKQAKDKEGNVTYYRFDLKQLGTIMSEPKGVDLNKTLDLAIKKANKGNFNVDQKTGETTGLGVGDEADIRSPNVVFRSNKDSKTVPKGKLYLMEPQLYRGHIRLYSKSGRPVVTRSNVSPSFQRLAKDIVERNTFEADDYSGLEPKETADANHFIKMTKPIQPRNINRLSNADTIYQLKKRYEVLVGELSAGNTGKVVLTEMEEILRKLIRMHAMNEKKGSELIRNLRAF